MTDEQHMALAIQEATLAAKRGDVPVGAVVVVNNTVIATAGNQRRSSADPTAHAEILALRSAAQTLGNWRVPGTLFVTQEPCPMCAGALVNARIEKLVYGCKNPKAGAAHTLYNIPSDPRLNHRMEIVSGVLNNKCSELLKKFFSNLRKSE